MSGRYTLSSGSIFLKPEIEVLVVSFGGVGTSFLSDAISKYARVNQFEDEDGYKHLPIAPLCQGSKQLKVIYVFGDPIVASISLFRRDFQVAQSRKLQRYNIKRKLIPVGMTIDQYARAGQDCFCFEQHYKNWHETYRYSPSLFVKYDAIHDSLPDIKGFLGLPEGFIKNFPAKIQRASSADGVSQECLEGLKAIHGAFAKKVRQLPDVEVLEPRRSRSFLTRLRPRYLLAIGVELKNVCRLTLKKICNK